MSDWPSVRPLDRHHGGVISTATALQGLTIQGFASTAWPSANLAILIPFRLAVPVTIYKMVAGAGATAAGNFAIGVYDAGGNRIIHSGATAKGADTEHIINVTDTRIGPGTYYLAMAADGTNNYIMFTPSGTVPAPLNKTRLMRILNVASAYSTGLPATLTLAAAAFAPVPAIAAYLRPH